MAGWIMANKEWVFSGIGLSVIGGIFFIFRKMVGNWITGQKGPQTVVTVNNLVRPQGNNELAGADLKSKIHILFIDDDAKFQVVNILKKAGWINTKRIKDVFNTDDAEVKCANILFIDIQGVGVALGFKDEGLGLALALKEKYPEKKVVIYSAESKGDRFHAALRKADSFLPKNAEPYEFQQLVEDYGKEIYPS